MQTRLRLVKGATALLYFGPLLAGLGNFGWLSAPIFVGIFWLWLFVMRPRLFPRGMADLKSSESWIRLLTPLVVQLLLVTILFGIGRGIGGILGALPAFPIMLPVGMSFLAVPFARIVWDPWKADTPAAILDKALRRGVNVDEHLHTEAMLGPLNDLPETISDADLAEHLVALRDHVDEATMFDILLSRVSAGEASTVGKRALVLMATDAGAISRLEGNDIAIRGLTAVCGDPALVSLFARRMSVAIAESPSARQQSPDSDILSDLMSAHPSAKADLKALLSMDRPILQKQAV